MPSDLETTRTFNVSDLEGKMLIKSGDKGEKVKKVQRALQRCGFDIEDDGELGSGPRAPSRNFKGATT